MDVFLSTILVAFLASVDCLVPIGTSTLTRNTAVKPSEDLLSQMDTERWLKLVNENSKQNPVGDEEKNELIPLMELPDTRAWQLVKNEPVGTEGPITLKDYFWNLGKLSEAEQRRVSESVSELFQRVKIPDLRKDEEEKLRTAVEVAHIALWGMRTQRSGELSIDRAVGVAVVLGEMRLSLDTILAGILHEVLTEVVDKDLYHKPLYYQEFERVFGEKATNLAAQYAVLPKYMSTKATYTDQQSENQMQNLVASTVNNEPLLIRLADRVHVMRNLHSFPLEEIDRQKIAQETLCVYAPLASKLGLSQVKGELEDFAFGTLNPGDFHKCSSTHFAASKVLESALNDIPDALRSNSILLRSGVKWYIQSRVKGKYQLYKKMERKGLSSPHEVHDALGLRLVLDVPREPGQSDEDYKAKCYAMCHLSSFVIENMKNWEKQKQKDYISCPKENGYQSLHCNFFNVQFDSTVEVQIRTMDMHRDAEVGESAHWFYKDMLYRPAIANGKAYKQTWRTEAQLRATSSEEIVNIARENLNKERVFVFMEDKGTVINLKKGSKTLDAAFAVHSNMGLYTQCVKANDVVVGLHRPLKMGDVVSVVTSDNVQAQRFWYDSVVSRCAKESLDKYFKNLNQFQICKALVKLLFAMYASAECIDKRYGVSGKVVAGKAVRVPNGRWLASKARDRTESKDIVDFLATLYKKDTTPLSAQEMIAKLFDISASNMTVMTENMSLIQVRKTVEARDPKMIELIERVVHPLIREEFPNLGVENSEETWDELVYQRSKAHMTRSSLSEKKVAAGEASESLSSDPRLTVQEAALAKQAMRDRLASLTRWIAVGPGGEHLPAGIKSPSEQISPIHLKSPFVLAGRPYSKEASSLPKPLMKKAKEHYAEESLHREARRAQSDRMSG